MTRKKTLDELFGRDPQTQAMRDLARELRLQRRAKQREAAQATESNLDGTTQHLQRECERYIGTHGMPPSQRQLEAFSGVNRKAIAARKDHLDLKASRRKE